MSIYMKLSFNLIKKECDKHIQQNGKMNDGDVFVSPAGHIGCRSNSIVVHAVGPCYTNGLNREETHLKNAVKNSLQKIEQKFLASKLISIAIPPISTGIFRYPVKDATKIITEALLDYLANKPDSKIKDIKLVSNEIETVKIWSQVLNDLSVKRGLKMSSSSASINLSKSSKWYWRDDDDKWKAYQTKYSNFIQSKFEEKQGNFDLEITERGSIYSVNLQTNEQTNLSTGYVHAITNSLPMTDKYEWCWLNDGRNHSPYSVPDSQLIESAFLSGKEFAEVKLKRHVDDREETYRIYFRVSLYNKKTNKTSITQRKSSYNFQIILKIIF